MIELLLALIKLLLLVFVNLFAIGCIAILAKRIIKSLKD